MVDGSKAMTAFGVFCTCIYQTNLHVYKFDHASAFNYYSTKCLRESERLLDVYALLQDGTGLLSAEQVCETCFQYNLPLTADQLSLLVRWCSEGERRGEEGKGGEREEGVRYRDLLELVNWQQELSTELDERMKHKNTEGLLLSTSHKHKYMS